MDKNDDILVFADEDATEIPPLGGDEFWKILVVDDDADVHTATEFALRSCEVLGRPLKLFHASSAREALATLSVESEIAVILLDAIMESEDAGLAAVREIREVLQIRDTRIVLRTGQPGQVPELETISRWDINDYKTKGELTRDRLITTLIAAVRSYDQIRRIEQSRVGLEKVVEASNNLMERRGLGEFAEGVITQIAGLIGVRPEGLVCVGESSDRGSSVCRIVAAAGRYGHLIDRDPAEIDHPFIAAELASCLREKRTRIGRKSLTLFFGANGGTRSFATYVDSSEPLRGVDARLIEVFCSNLSISAENVDLVERLRRRAYEDSLVGLPNLSALIERIDAAASAGDGGVLALLDIDQFGHINDVLGHKYGDAVLVAVAGRLAERLRPSCFVARVASDEFAVFGPGSLVNEEALRALVSEPLRVGEETQQLSFSLGVLDVAQAAATGSEAVRNAHIALQRARSSGIGHAVRYNPKIGEEARDSSRLLKRLRTAFAGQQLTLFFQPQVSLSDSSPIGFESLLRWRLEDGSYVPPSRFIPLAEYSGLIVPLGEWIIRAALSARNRLAAAGYPELRIAVNVSAVQLRDPSFLPSLDEAFRDTGTDGSALEVEITESVSALGVDGVTGLIRGLKDRGVSVAIDDFGTGYSSLSSIEQWPVDRLKIDRSFVEGLDSRNPRARIVDMIVPLGQRLSLNVLAEGVETPGELDYLAKLGCAEAQGYFFGKPMPLEEAIEWLDARRSGA